MDGFVVIICVLITLAAVIYSTTSLGIFRNKDNKSE